MKTKSIKTYDVIRIVEMRFQVCASSRKEAKLNIQDPHSVKVKSEKIKLSKS